MKKLLVLLILGFLFSVNLSADSVKICTLSKQEGFECTYTCPDGSSYKGQKSGLKPCPNNLKLVCDWSGYCKVYYY